MDGINKILTPTMIWKDFDDSLPLKESRVSEMSYNGILYTETYFSGREVEGNRVRIFGLYAKPTQTLKNKKYSALLILPDYTKTIDMEIVTYFVNQGYHVLMVDYRGENDKVNNFTNYPNSISYANLSKNDNVFSSPNNANETCWYEWVAVAKYSLNYLLSKAEIDNVGVIGIKQGGNVGWQLIANESRVSCFVTLFGIGWQAYNGVFKYDEKEIELNDERYRWLGGVDAHAYAQYAKCPILYLAGTNSSLFDCDRGVDTLARVSNQTAKCHFNYSPRLSETIDKKCVYDIDVFLKKYLNNSALEKYYFANQPQLQVACGQDGYEVFAEVTPDLPDKVKCVSVFISEGINNPANRNWANMTAIPKKDSEKRYYKFLTDGDSAFVNIFAVVEYKNGVCLSSKIVNKKIATQKAHFCNLLYSSSNGTDSFSICDEKKDCIGEIFRNDDGGVDFVCCANGIFGASSKYGLITFRINESRFKPNSQSILKMDVYCEEYTCLKICAICENMDSDNNFYSTTIELNGSKVWQNIQIVLDDLKNQSLSAIKNYSAVVAIKLVAESRFAINNMLLI